MQENYNSQTFILYLYMYLMTEDHYQKITEKLKLNFFVITAVEPGTVVVTNKTFNEFLREEHEIVSWRYWELASSLFLAVACSCSNAEEFKNTMLDTFITVHRVPYNSKYHFWTGLLLLVRAGTCSSISPHQWLYLNSDKPQTAVLVKLYHHNLCPFSQSDYISHLFAGKGKTTRRTWRNLPY